MSTLSVPLTPLIEQMIEKLVASGVADSKAGVVRKAVLQFAENQAVLDVLEAEQEAKDGKILTGDLDELAEKL
jgi:Arc/MetJ-type ribon-helix-helix transcriptional regulator